MLQEVLDFIHNYFIKAPNPGTYTITGDTISPLPPLQNGQRIWIVGSAMNDGVYTYRDGQLRDDDDTKAAGLQDETFAGTICALSVPPRLAALSGEIKLWVENNSKALDGPFASESFNGYSYSLKTGRSTNGGTAPLSWRDHFKPRLEQWRKPYL